MLASLNLPIHVVTQQFVSHFAGINVKICGKGEVEWRETRSHSSDSTNSTMNNMSSNATAANTETTEVFRSEEMYFENKFSVFGGGNIFHLRQTP
jgi:hypothetical protein